MSSVLISAPPSALDWEQFSGNVSGKADFDRIVADTAVLAQIHQITKLLTSFGAEPYLILRPEFLSSPRAMAYALSKTGPSTLHVGFWPYSQPKLIQGVSNYLYCLSNNTVEDVSRAIDLLVDCPMITNQLDGVIGGLRVADVEAGSPFGAPPRYLMPPIAETARTLGSGRLGALRRHTNIFAPLKIDFRNISDSAQAMVDASSDLKPAFWQARDLGERTFLAVMSLDGDLPTGLGPLVQELALMENGGEKFDLVIGVQDLQEISVGTVSPLLERLVRSIHLSGTTSTSFWSNNIRIVSTRSETFLRLVEGYLRYFLVIDPEALECNGGRMALMSGMTPIFLEGMVSGIQTLDDLAIRPDNIMSSIETPFGSTGRRTAWGQTFFRHPAPGAVRAFANRLLHRKGQMPEIQRKEQAQRARSLFGELASVLSAALAGETA